MRAQTSHSDDALTTAPTDALTSVPSAWQAWAQLLAFFLVWSGSGGVAAWALRRRGEEFGPSLALGCGLGPLAFVPVLAERGRPFVERTLRRAEPGAGEVDVVASVHGLDVSAVVEAGALFGDRIRRFTAVAAVEHAALRRSTAALQSAALGLEVAAALAGRRAPELAVIGGAGDEAVVAYARQHGFRYVVLPACTTLSPVRARRLGRRCDLSIVRLPVVGHDGVR